MIRQELDIEKYDWHLIVLYKANQDLAAIIDELWYLNCPAKLARQALKVITHLNTGFCYTNDALKATLICVAEANSDEEFVNTVVHETRHLQSHICSYYGISEKGEEAAYLLGDTFTELYKVFKYELDKPKSCYCRSYQDEQQSGDYWSSTSEYPQFNSKFSWSECRICRNSNSSNKSRHT